MYKVQLRAEFNLFVPDCPGFGVSTALPNNSIPATTDVLLALIREVSGERPIYIVAHSVSSIIGTSICQELGKQLSAFFSVEGNLTVADAYFSSLVTQYTSVSAFQREFIETIYNRAKDDAALRRYFAGVQVATLAGLEGWGKSSAELSKAELAGRQFQELGCRKIYYWDEQSASSETQEFIRTNHIPNLKYKHGGHWPMIKQPEICYKDMFDFFLDTKD